MGRTDSFQPLLRLVSAMIGAGLFALSCAGFHHASKSRAGFEDQTTFGCICFLGACFGILLTFAELNWGLFYFFFGFLRYRIGRAAVFVVAGIMIGLIGKNLDRQCACDSYAVLIVEGIACVAMAAVHLVAIFVFGNNTKPVVPPNTGAASPAASASAYQQQPASIVPPASKRAPRSAQKNKSDSTPLEPVTESTPAPQPQSPRSPEGGGGDPNMPAWMKA
ncbi:hypothetical protein PybrP1_010349 [[Pythium] brassicae (nom. inval.)]|nr:hypothetical protein PybrP1_010349 [[Pythium] brassicae (nom. inval.)]